MGVDSTFCVVYGVKLPYVKGLADFADDNNVYDKYDAVVIDDCMCSEYTVVGHPILKCDDTSPDFVEIDSLTDLDSQRADVLKLVEEHFPQILEAVSVPWKLLAFIHYS